MTKFIHIKPPYLYILFIIVMFSCEVETDWKLHTDNSPLIVVDGVITNERKAHIIKLTKPIYELNSVAEPVTGAIVAINYTDTSVELTETSDNSGIYKTDSTFMAVTGIQYQLTILFENKTYTASAYMVHVTPFKILTYKYIPDTNMYKIVSIGGSFDSQEASMWEIFLDWSDLPDYNNTNEINKAKLIYYTLPSLDVNQIFAPEKEIIYFPKGTKIIQKKFSLTNEHAEFIRTLLSETEWRGGYFDAIPANLATNLSEGAVGYFGACSVISDSLIVQ
ncbi:MAG: DUF4249 family protein [Bacteroidales bacterium]|nr:DUF4249 family protein [Bacteroidales bacterium]